MVVSQGDIVKIDFDPQLGHEQGGYRPAVVVSNDVFNSKTNMTVLCPITSTKREFPLHVPLDNRTKTTGTILCEHFRSMDLSARNFVIVEKLPEDLLQEVVNILISQIDIIPENALSKS